jgi:hypothetical protein
MNGLKFKGFQMIDGTKEGFDPSSLKENGYVYFIRTDAEGESGYIYFNKRKYGIITEINAGEY